MVLYDLGTLLRENSYPGRGIIIGMPADGKNAAIAYFIMGRSENSRNRIFERLGSGMRTRAYDESKLTDPSLIIYAPFRTMPYVDIVTNGDQTDTIYDALLRGDTFRDALMTREFEPDAPNYTPRISGIVNYGTHDFSYELSILKSGNGDPSVLSHNNTKRGVRLLCVALALTVVTAVIMPMMHFEGAEIYFGILHLLSLWKTIVYQPVPDSIIYLCYLHQLQI